MSTDPAKHEEDEAERQHDDHHLVQIWPDTSIHIDYLSKSMNTKLKKKKNSLAKVELWITFYSG